MSRRTGKPIGIKVKGRILSEALRRSQMRQFVRSGMNSHDLADAAEAFMIYGWLAGTVTLEECVSTVSGVEDLTEGLTLLMTKIRKRAKLS